MCLISVFAPAAAFAQEPKGEPTAEPTGPTAVEQLMADFGYGEDALVTIDDVRVGSAHALDMRAEVTTLLAQQAPRQASLKERVRLLTEFADESDLEEVELVPRVRRLAIAQIQVADMQATASALKTSGESLDRESALLGTVLGDLEGREAAAATAVASDTARQKELEADEAAAKKAAEEARQREAETKDAVLKQLYAREREVRDQLVEIATARRQASDAEVAAKAMEAEFNATRGDILGQVDALTLEPTATQSQELVDPLLGRILLERRRLWAALPVARKTSEKSDDAFAAATQAVEAGQAKVTAERNRERELGGGELWKQRVKVAQTELKLAEAQLEVATDQRTQSSAHVALLEEGVEFFSKELREVVSRASDKGRLEVYGVLNDDAWSDAFQRLNDKLQSARHLFSSRVDAATGLTDQWLQLALWLGGLAWRAFLALLLGVALRFVPAVSRRILNFIADWKFFRRRPSLAIKLFEVLRASARPALVYVGVTYVVAYVTASLPELVFVQWGIDAFFVYFIGVRVSATLALPRWYREREGMAATGGEDDLRADEAAIADLLRLDLEHGNKFVRSAKIVLLVATVWYFAPAIVVAITGASVLSGLITTLTRLAILLVVIVMLSTWSDELSGIFSRLAGDRLPKATDFVERNKNRIWGVLVLAVVSVIVIVWEIIKFVRRAVLGTEWFKSVSAYAFKTKIELQQRDEPTDDEVRAFLPDDLEHAFDNHDVVGTSQLIERDWMKESRDKINILLERGNGAGVIVGDPGVGKSTMLRWLVDGRETISLLPPHRIFEKHDLMKIFAPQFGREIDNDEELHEALDEIEPTVFVLDGLERMFLRDIDGYGCYQALMAIVHKHKRRHVFLFTVTRISWEFLTRVYDQRHVFHNVLSIPRWTDEELRELVERRMAGMDYATSFTELADFDGADSTEVVKTARGYYRYLAEFTRGLPATAMHYWLRSLGGGTGKVYSVGLFTRPTGAALVAAAPAYRFMLAAIAQHGSLSAVEASRVDNTPQGTCELGGVYFSEAGAIVKDGDTYVLTPAFMTLTLRHLEDSNLI